ncbi:hypothetical protein N7486_003541 [Penicillium sp. IBT 16267x]|nr:hypothetical protein N7486_003541 [Penicillium sp. IBT 16267x]
MLEVNCTGSPRAIGLTHGTAARSLVHGSLAFYKMLFQTKCKMDWSDAKIFARIFHPYLEQNWPQYVAEMEGVAEGAGVSYEDILVLNVRTEIAYGAFNDGCTGLSWKGKGKSLLGQNWDWNLDQAPNLLRLNIKKEDGTSIQMIAEAGILGKIGLNSHGVGCTLNAITAHGVSYNKLPCHLALRTILESTSRSAAIQTLEAEGVASSCHLLVADVTGGTGLECSSEDIVRLEMDPEGLVMHTNHYILPHNEKVVESKNLLPDTWYRLRRIGELVDAVKEEGPSIEVVERLFLDEVEGDGSSICRHYQDVDELATLFRIVMDLGERRATVSVGLPVDPVENFELRP